MRRARARLELLSQRSLESAVSLTDSNEGRPVASYVSSLRLVSSPILEQQLTSPDGEIAGTPDLVLDTEDGLIVIDYKSGVVTNEGVPKVEHERQLQIYSALAADSLRWPVLRAVLVSFKERDPFIDVRIDVPRRQTSMENVRKARRRFNHRVPGQQPANPAPTTCQWCPHQERCPAFWDSITDTWDEHLIGTAVSGIVTTTPERAANRQCAVHVDTDAGTLEPGNSLLTHLPDWVANQSGISSRISAVGLGSRTVDQETTLLFQPKSRISIGTG